MDVNIYVEWENKIIYFKKLTNTGNIIRPLKKH